MWRISSAVPFHTASWEWRMAAPWSWICKGKTACLFEDMDHTRLGGNCPRICVFRTREFPRKSKHSSKAYQNTFWAKAYSSCNSKQLARLEDKTGTGLFNYQISIRLIICLKPGIVLSTRMTKQEALVATLWLKRLLAGFSAGMRNKPGLEGRIFPLTTEAFVNLWRVSRQMIFSAFRTENDIVSKFFNNNDINLTDHPQYNLGGCS